MEALTFLQSVAGYARAQDGGSPNKPVRLGTVDPAYAGPPALPKVTFDGEDTMSAKEYAYSGVAPAPSDRVALIPVGTTYLIVGAIGGASGAVPVSRGGTGLTSVTAGNFLKGNGTGALVSTTPATVRSDIGANSAANLTTGALPVARLSTAIATGTINITPSAANTPTSGTWTYGSTLVGTVNIQVSAQSGVPGTVTEVTSNTPTSTNTLVWVSRTNTTLTVVYCAAFGGF